MKTYTFSFKGREVGAIGVMGYFRQTVQAETEEAARLKLYDTHEHIMHLQLESVNEKAED
jgi:hypothetical protein